MTEQEAEVLAARLTRIWMPQKVDYCYMRYDPYPDPNAFYYTGYLEGDVRLDAEDGGGHEKDGHISLVLTVGEISLEAHTSQEEVADPAFRWTREHLEAHKHRIDEWMPFFRRGCWLSGVPLEATAHEKAEWIQGFKREELEAWNLKM